MRSKLFASVVLIALSACQSRDMPTQSTALDPLQVTRVSSVANRDRVLLVWSVSGVDGRQFEVMRQNRVEPWKHFSMVAPVDGLITVDDTGVVPGQSYRYRLRIFGAPRDQFLDEVEVEVPR